MEKQNNEQVLLDMAKELERKNKTIWTTMWVIVTVSLVGLLAASFYAGVFMPEGPGQLALILGACVLFIPACFYALKLEVSVGAYKCKHCAHEMVPTYKQALNAPHFGTTRYMKCPKCGKKSWQKKVLTKK